MGITFNAEITEKGDIKADELVNDLLGLKPGDTVLITVNNNDEDGIDDSNGLK